MSLVIKATSAVYSNRRVITLDWINVKGMAAEEGNRQERHLLDGMQEADPYRELVGMSGNCCVVHQSSG